MQEPKTCAATHGTPQSKYSEQILLVTRMPNTLEADSQYLLTLRYYRQLSCVCVSTLHSGSPVPFGLCGSGNDFKHSIVVVMVVFLVMRILCCLEAI